MTVSRLMPLLLAFTLAAQTPHAIENELARVRVVTAEPAQKADLNRVLIYLGSATERILWVPAGERPASANVGGQPLRIIEVELKNAGAPFQPPVLDTVKLWPDFFRIPIDNRQVRVLVAHIPPRQKIAFHEHALNRLLVNVTDQDFRVIDASGKSAEIKAKAGDLHWAKPNKHTEENLSDQPFEGVVVELK